MDLERLAKEREANAEYGAWLENLEEVIARAKELRAVYRDAGLPLPPSLAAFLSEPERLEGTGAPRLLVTPPLTPPRPAEAKAKWIWVPLADANLTSVVLCVLRHLDGTRITTAELFQNVLKLQPGANEGSMFNIGLRLDGKVIERSDDGWAIADRTKAPVLHEGYLWGPPAGVFQAQEIASHRRLLVLHVLRAAGTKGMKLVEIARQLIGADYCHIPVNKDLVKMDLAALEGEKKVRQMGSSRNWVVVEQRA